MDELSSQQPEISDQKTDEVLAKKIYETNETPQALIKLQKKLTTPWVLSEIRRNIGLRADILDLNCGAGFFANEAALINYSVTGLDASPIDLRIAKKNDTTNSVKYLQANPMRLPFSKERFDVVVALDLIGKVSDPDEIFIEASRVLKPGGLLFFESVNRTFFSYLFFKFGWRFLFKSRSTPSYAYSLFRRPQEIEEILEEGLMHQQVLKGYLPEYFSRSFWQSLWSHKINDKFNFKWSKSIRFIFVGYAKKYREQ